MYVLGSDDQCYAWQKLFKGKFISQNTNNPTIKHGSDAILVGGCLSEKVQKKFTFCYRHVKPGIYFDTINNELKQVPKI